MPDNRLLTVCRLLNKQHAKYLVVGGFALNLHGLIRATKDVDLLIPRDEINARKVLSALVHLTFGISKELDPKEVANKPCTIIGDIPRVDLLTVAGKIKYSEAVKHAKKVRIRGVWIPFVDIPTLIATKNTDRLQDKADIERLSAILQQENPKERKK